LLHGWTGDEESMGIIARKFPDNFWILSPRAPYQADHDGYSWLPPGGGLHSTVDEYLPGLESFLTWMNSVEKIKQISTKFDLAGFSQGAATAYALALTKPERIHLLAGLAGFLPRQADRYIDNQPLKGKKVFLAHGREDERIRIEAGYEAASALGRAGAEVTFCASDTGHKLGSDCHRRLVDFFTTDLSTT
jgi:phospholipase/carboxylesterase